MTGRILKVKKKNNWLQGVYKSPKSRKLHYFKSSWELKFYKLLDSLKIVREWESECIKIPYILKGKKKGYYPDVLINRKYLVEIKPKEQVNWLMNKEKFKSAKKLCEIKNWKFLVLTKEMLSSYYLTEELKKS